MQREASEEPNLARLKPREPHSCHAGQSGLLRDDLDVAEAGEQRNILSSEIKYVRL
jgi:hypothetical protein